VGVLEPHGVDAERFDGVARERPGGEQPPYSSPFRFLTDRAMQFLRVVSEFAHVAKNKPCVPIAAGNELRRRSDAGGIRVVAVVVDAYAVDTAKRPQAPCNRCRGLESALDQCPVDA